MSEGKTLGNNDNIQVVGEDLIVLSNMARAAGKQMLKLKADSMTYSMSDDQVNQRVKDIDPVGINAQFTKYLDAWADTDNVSEKRKAAEDSI